MHSYYHQLLFTSSSLRHIQENWNTFTNISIKSLFLGYTSWKMALLQLKLPLFYPLPHLHSPVKSSWVLHQCYSVGLFSFSHSKPLVSLHSSPPASLSTATPFTFTIARVIFLKPNMILILSHLFKYKINPTNIHEGSASCIFQYCIGG